MGRTVDYNQIMGGIDNDYHLRNIRSVSRRSIKLYSPNFNWVIDAAFTNSWIVSKIVNKGATKKRTAEETIPYLLLRSLLESNETQIII